MRFLMQVYADVLRKPIKVPDIKQAGAMGSAVFAAFAGGTYKTVKDATDKMVNVEEKVYYPNIENSVKYDKLYEKYLRLSKYFAEENKAM